MYAYNLQTRLPIYKHQKIVFQQTVGASLGPQKLRSVSRGAYILVAL